MSSPEPNQTPVFKRPDDDAPPTPPTRLAKVLAIGVRFAGMLEKIVKRQMPFLQRWPGTMNLIGLGIASGGLRLAGYIAYVVFLWPK